jgi:CRP/FNR family cyclic AMP-dependent transcriptional regulator
VNFLECLDAEARKLLLAAARPIRHSKGERLLRYGEPSRGAYILKEGAAEATVLLPGGERLVVATLRAGGMFGETALIERGTCTATVTASAPLEGWFIEREEFRSLVAQRAGAPLRIQHAVTLEISRKLRALNARLMEIAALDDTPASSPEPGSDPLAGVMRLAEAPFDIWAFLPHLAVFEDFDPGEIAAIVSVCSLVELPPAHAVFRLGHPSTACFIVVRGAVEIRARHAMRERRMAVLGPGQFIGYMSALERGAHGADAIVREPALLLEIPRAAFEKLYLGASSTATKLHRVIQRSLLHSLGQTNRHLTRLISHARLRGAAKEGDELEKAYGGQIVSGDRAA